MQLTVRHRQYWQRTLGITGRWLLMGFVVTFVSAVSADFARDPNGKFFGWRPGFWLAGLVALIASFLFSGFCAHPMSRPNQELGVAPTEAA